MYEFKMISFSIIDFISVGLVHGTRRMCDLALSIGLVYMDS